MALRTAAVIGCGPAGMATAARLRQKGLMVTCFDVAAEAGGMWNATGHDLFTSRGVLSPLYSSMRCVLPKDLMSFSDMRMPFTAPQFPHHTVVRGYLHKYAIFKGTNAVTRFNSKVESVRFDDASKAWKLVTVNVVTSDVHEWTFHCVAVCTGQCQKPRYPSGHKEILDAFLRGGGEVTHSAHVKQFRSYRNRRVLVVGDGVGAYDCMRELLRHGASVTHSTLLAKDDPDVLNTLRCSFNSLGGHGAGSATASNTPAARSGKLSRDPLTLLPAALRLSRVFSRRSDHHAHEVLRKWLRLQNSDILRVPRVGRLLGSNDERQLICEEDPTASTLTSSAVLDEAVRRGKAKRLMGDAAGSSSSASTSVEDSSLMLPAFDAVVFATGYQLAFPFLHPDIRRRVEAEKPLLLSSSLNGGSGAQDPPCADVGALSSNNRRGLYLGTLWAEQPTLSFIGTQRDLLPPFLLFEAQALFTANAFTGRIALPPNAAAMFAKEDEMVRERPHLASVSSDRGVGLHSVAYFNALTEQSSAVDGNLTYSGSLLSRKWWALGNAVLSLVHKFRSMAPLKRKKQHVLFSNKV